MVETEKPAEALTPLNVGVRAYRRRRSLQELVVVWMANYKMLKDLTIRHAHLGAWWIEPAVWRKYFRGERF